MAYIQKRKNKSGKVHYRVQIRLKGCPMQTGTFERLTDAKRWIQSTETSIREGRYFKTLESKKHTMTEAIERYKNNILVLKPRSIRKQTAQLDWWDKEIGDYKIGEVTAALLVEKRDKLSKGKTPRGNLRTAATVNRYLAVLSHLFTISVNEWQWLDDTPMRKVSKLKESNGRTRFLSDEERTRLLLECKKCENKNLYIVVLLGICTGMRRGEIMNLKWSNIDFRNEMIALENTATKNQEARNIPVTGPALTLLKELNKVRNIYTNLLFPGRNPQNPVDLRHHWYKALADSGIKDFRFHDLRHTCASYLAMNKASIIEIAKGLGHKGIEMSNRYSHLNQAHMHKVYDDMTAKIFGSSK